MIMETICVWCRVPIFRHYNDINFVCQKCSERKTMPNIKITAEVDGKQVPLETVSTETFEAIKALEKPKEIPVARLATCGGNPRLLFKPTEDIHLLVGQIYVLDLKEGDLCLKWVPEMDIENVTRNYKNIRPL